LSIGSRFTLHASFPRSVTLTQLRFTLLTVTSSQRDLHPHGLVCPKHPKVRRLDLRKGYYFLPLKVPESVELSSVSFPLKVPLRT